MNNERILYLQWSIQELSFFSKFIFTRKLYNIVINDEDHTITYNDVNYVIPENLKFTVTLLDCRTHGFIRVFSSLNDDKGNVNDFPEELKNALLFENVIMTDQHMEMEEQAENASFQ